LSHVDEDYCILDVGGVGYQVYCPQRTLRDLEAIRADAARPDAGHMDEARSETAGRNSGTETVLFTRLIHRDDCMELYGFTGREEHLLFNLLITVSGIGPRQSLKILGARDVGDIVRAVVSEDSAFLMSLAGIGSKKAQQIILELKEKVKRLFGTDQTPLSSTYIEALSALESLGFSPGESRRAVDKALASAGQNQDLGNIVETALKLLS
jgi:Holliday junction DNA helicase RuvA